MQPASAPIPTSAASSPPKATSLAWDINQFKAKPSEPVTNAQSVVAPDAIMEPEILATRATMAWGMYIESIRTRLKRDLWDIARQLSYELKDRKPSTDISIFVPHAQASIWLLEDQKSLIQHFANQGITILSCHTEIREAQEDQPTDPATMPDAALIRQWAEEDADFKAFYDMFRLRPGL